MEEIGRRLRAAREARELTLQVVEDETKIRRKYIEALESGRVADLPGDAYVKGFLRTYGNYLGLDGTALVEEYKQSAQAGPDENRPAEPVRTRPTEAAAAARAPVSRPAPATRPAPEARPAREPQAARPAAERPRPERRPGQHRRPGKKQRPLGAILVVAALVGSVAFLGWRIFSPGAQPEPKTPPVTPPPTEATKQPDPTPPPVVPEPPKVSMARGTGEDVVFTVPAKEVTVRIEPTSPLWLTATVDGKDAGQSTSAQAREFKGSQIRIRVGHMDNVSLVVNGQRFEKPLDNRPYNLIFQGQ